MASGGHLLPVVALRGCWRLIVAVVSGVTWWIRGHESSNKSQVGMRQGPQQLNDACPLLSSCYECHTRR